MYAPILKRNAGRGPNDVEMRLIYYAFIGPLIIGPAEDHLLENVRGKGVGDGNEIHYTGNRTAMKKR